MAGQKRNVVWLELEISRIRTAIHQQVLAHHKPDVDAAQKRTDLAKLMRGSETLCRVSLATIVIDRLKTRPGLLAPRTSMAPRR